MASGARRRTSLPPERRGDGQRDPGKVAKPDEVATLVLGGLAPAAGKAAKEANLGAYIRER
jgi:hypothetical protein